MQLPGGSRVSSVNQTQQLCKIRRFMGPDRCVILRAKVHKGSPRLFSRYLHQQIPFENRNSGACLKFLSHIFSARPQSM